MKLLYRLGLLVIPAVLLVTAFGPATDIHSSDERTVTFFVA